MSDTKSNEGLASWFAAVELTEDQAEPFLSEAAAQLAGNNYDVSLTSSGLFGILTQTAVSSDSDQVTRSDQAWVRITLTSEGNPGEARYAAVAVAARTN